MGRAWKLMGKAALLTAIVAMISGFVWAARYDGVVRRAAAERFGDVGQCWFDGDYDPSGVPGAQIMAQGVDVVHPWQDFRNAVLVSDGAKPFHFGIVIPQPGGQPPKVWGWSYRAAAFWPVPEGRLLALALNGRGTVGCNAIR